MMRKYPLIIYAVCIHGNTVNVVARTVGNAVRKAYRMLCKEDFQKPLRSSCDGFFEDVQVAIRSWSNFELVQQEVADYRTRSV